MHLGRWIVTVSVFGVIGLIPLLAQRGATPPAAVDDPVKTLADRLDLEKYKGILRGLAQFGDRRQGTERNRQAVDWIEAQLKDSGCTNTERIKYMVPDPAATPATARRGAAPPTGQRGQAARGTGGVGRQAKVIETGEVIASQGGGRLYGVSA